MIVFNSIGVKNFLSYGNVESTMQVDAVKNTLISGRNGSGKSSIVGDALCYALYGKPYRPIKLPQLINSINQKGMVCTVRFTIGNIHYRVVRGMKPALFEIYKDNKLIDQEAATKDYQGYLEKSILKINFKTFCQVVILGTASFVPFMQLNAAQRRDVIEDILDISIFSDMNALLKTRMAENKEQTTTVSYSIESAKKETVAQQKVIKVLEEARTGRIHEEELEIDSLNAERDKKAVSRDVLKTDIERLAKGRTDKVDPAEVIAAERIVNRLEDEMSRLTKRSKSVSVLDDCPTCLQTVSDTHKSTICRHNDDLIAEIETELFTAKLRSEKLQEMVTAETETKNEIIRLTSAYNEFAKEITRIDKDIAKRQQIITDYSENSTDIATEKLKLKTTADTALSLIKHKTTLLEEKAVQDVSLLLLKDSGIKAAIIKEYIPILNRLINKYLGSFGFFINFTLDENFNEKILSRGRDEFSYGSFSEGEKAKIDLALMFAFRDVTEMKNSANCNLLVLDELGESSLDLNAREAFMEILTSLPGGNNFVISHSAPSHEAYDRVIKVSMKSEFSIMEYI